MDRVSNGIEEIIGDWPETYGRLVLPEDVPPPGPDGLAPALLDEAAAIILAGSDELLHAELDLVLKGLSFLLENEEDPDAMGLPSRLIQRLPSQREKIVEALEPLCSEKQKKLLLE